MMLPIVTGNKLPIRKLLQVRAGKSADVLPIEAQNASGAPALMNKPHRNEIYVGDAVLEARVDECRYRRNDRDDPVDVVRAL